MRRTPLFAALLPMTLLFAPADAQTGAGGPVAEIVTFRLLPGLDQTGFLALARATEAPLAAQPGFLRRSLSVDDTGLWTDYVEWTDLPTALMAAEAVMADPAFAPFGQAIDPQGMVMRHAPILWRMGN